MIKRLRRQLISIIMLLVSIVLVSTLGLSFWAAYNAQSELVANSLEHALARDFDVFHMIAQERPMAEARGSMLCLVAEVEYDDGELLIESNNAPVAIDDSTLKTVVLRVVSEGQASGSDNELRVAWDSVATGEDWRVAIADTTFVHMTLRDQAIHNLVITVLALLALFAIAWWLSNWALKPVELAWEQQRRFVADASHELKTPLAVILANTQILERNESIGDDAMRWVKSTSDEAEHMKALVNDLLQLARADESVSGSSASAMRHEDVDLSEIVESAALEFDAIAFERGCLLEADVDPDLHTNGDPEWLERMVRILIDNACKYGAEGTTVDVKLQQASGHTTLTVHNMGNPIDPEDLPHVFERFYRSDKARSRQAEGGFGLGLAIAKSIVDAHGGKIGVASTPQEGTTFTVVL